MTFDAQNAKPLVAMLVFPGLTMLDMVGPQTALAPVMNIQLVARTLDAITSDTGIIMSPDIDFAHAPANVDVLFVPGGGGTAAAMDDDTLAYLADRGSRATYVTSVCTGSLLLGAAGLLKGYRAGCHWAALHLLEAFGAEPSKERVVIDRNRITGGGVTAGIDFGLTLLAEMISEDAARLSQLMMEYNPEPPFDSGTPDAVPAELVTQVRAFTQPGNDAIAWTAASLGFV
jgi:transcriptional regulator GlxA family with amidase domain